MDKKKSKAESLARGILYGAVQQPADALAAIGATGYSNLLGDGSIDLNSALASAKAHTMQGGLLEAQQQNPEYFTGGQLVGNIAGTILPSTGALKAVGAAGKAAEAINMAKAAKVADAIVKGRGVLGTLGQGAVQGAASTTWTDADPTSGAIGGAIGSGVFGLGKKIADPVSKTIDPIRKKMVEALSRQGVSDISAGQATGNRAIQAMESVLKNLPFTAGKAQKQAETQLGNFTKAALKKAGINANAATPEALKAAEEKFNQGFSDIIKNTLVNVDDQALNEIGQIASNQLDKLPTNVKPVVQSYLRDIVQSGGKIAGDAYQVARSNLTKQARSMVNSDPYTAQILRQIRNTLDDAAERSLPQDLQGVWRQLRGEYANFKTIQDAVSKTTNDAVYGILSPKALLQSSMRANPSRSQKGYGELYDLARSGAGVLPDAIPDSGTAQRLFYQQLLTGGGLGTAAYMGTGDPQSAIMAGAGAVALPKAAQSVLSSPAFKNYVTHGTSLGRIMEKVPSAVVSSISAQLDKNREVQQDFSDIEQFLNTPQPAQPANDFQDIEQFLNSQPQSNAGDLFERIKMKESGGNPNAQAKTSSASGLYQFTNSTWKDMVGKYGAQYGITEEMKNDPQAQEIMVRHLAQDNAEILANAGIEPNDQNIYFAHFMGAPAAAKALSSNPQTVAAQVFPSAARANQTIFFRKDGTPRTIGEVYQVVTRGV